MMMVVVVVELVVVTVVQRVQILCWTCFLIHTSNLMFFLCKNKRKKKKEKEKEKEKEKGISIKKIVSRLHISNNLP